MDRISPAALEAEGEKILGKRRMDRLKATVRRWHQRNVAAGGEALDEARWMEEVYLSVQRQLWGGDRHRADRYSYTAPPAAGWMEPGFDDSTWLDQRAPAMVGAGLAVGGFRRAGFFRFCLDVPDPDKAVELRLELAYAGGARVFLNGKEIARGHLPEGRVGPDARGADYPLGAYVELDEDGAIVQTRQRRREGLYPSFIGELPGAFDEATRAYDRKKKEIPGVRLIGNRRVDRRLFERVRAARARVLGPLALPGGLLRKGGNVLAIEIRTSDFHPVLALAARRGWESRAASNVAWSHGHIHRLRLRATAGVPSVLERPQGVRIWCEDMHRPVISSEFLARGLSAGALRLVGARNGVFSAQIVVSTDRQLTNLKVTPSELNSPDGSVIPASAVRVSWMVPHRLDEWKDLGWGPGGADHCRDPLCPPAALALRRHGPPGVSRRPRENRVAALKELRFFDHIGTAGQTPAPVIPAHSCRPIWVTLEVPADLPAGPQPPNARKYRGSVRIEAKGMDEVAVPLEAEVHDWRIPGPLHFQANAALEQSPYGVAGRYNVPLWSDEHFELMEASFEQLAKVGNDWVNVPVITFTEFGNLRDSMIRWGRRSHRPGSGRARDNIAFDYSILDRYLALAVRHLGVPKVISFVILHGEGGDPSEVELLDEATGRMQTLQLDSDAPEYTGLWKTFATSLQAHVKELANVLETPSGAPARGLEKSMHWGYLWDNAAALPELPPFLAGVTPGVKWTAGAHRGSWGYYYLGAYAQLLPFRLTEQSRMGWKNRGFHVLLPRSGGSVIGGDGIAFPFTFRLLVDRALVVGLNGVGRTGADYWGQVYTRGLRRHGWKRTGMPNHYMLWPGKRPSAGAEPSARFMALREGYQETEARIFLEQLLERDLLAEGLAKRVKEVLFEHHRQTLFIPSVDPAWQYVELCRDWQDRSRRLFGIAAEAARAVPLDLDRRQIAAVIPARGRTTVPLRLRVWSPRPREWKASADQCWIRPAKTSSRSAGHEGLPITLDAAGLKPGAPAKGTLTVTDTTSGRTHAVAIEAVVGPVLEAVPTTAGLDRKQLDFVPDDGKEVFTAVPGRAAARILSFRNRSGVEIAWRAAASPPWLAVEPSSGKAGPGAVVFLEVTARPPAEVAGRHAGTITIAEVGGPAAEEIPVVVYALPPYRPPQALPKGAPVLLAGKTHEQLLKSHREWRAHWCGHQIFFAWEVKGSGNPAGGRERGHPVASAVTMPAPAETIYRLAGQGFRAFSARADFPKDIRGHKYWGFCAKMPHWLRMRFEVYVDGELRAHSGWMGPDDDLRTLVVEDLAGAKELRLVTRYSQYPAYPATAAWWDMRLYR